jgi:thiopurine S-methyltransferase
MDLDQNYWSTRYRQSETGWDLGAMSPPLKAYFDQLENKQLKILIPGAGNAYEAEYLAQNGFTNVYVCDLAAEPLQNLKQRCPQINPAHLLQVNFFELEEKDFDLVIEQTFFCAINPSLRQRYFNKMQTLLKPGGRLVGLLFNDTLNSDHPPFGGNKQEYLGYIRQPFTIHTLDTCYNSVKPRAGRELFINLLRNP